MLTRPRSTLEELLLAAAQGQGKGVGAVPLGGGVPASVRPDDEFQPPDWQKMLNYPAAPAPPPINLGGRLPGGIGIDPDIPVARPPIYSGERTEGLSPLGKLLAKRRQLSDPRNLNREVFETAEGIEVAPEGGPPSRKKQALMGLLQGIVHAGQASGGDPWATLAGAATGAGAGAISPKLVKALTRDQEVQRVQGQINQEQKNTLGQAQIAETEEQTRQRAAQPELEALRILQQHQRDTATAADRTTRSDQAAKANDIRAKTLEETIRKNKADEGKRTKVTIGGKEFDVSSSQAATIEAERERSGGKLDPHQEATIEAQIEGNNEVMYRGQKDEAKKTVQDLRKKRETLTHKSRKNTDGSWGWAEDPSTVRRNESSIRDIDRQITDAERDADTAERSENAAIVRKGNSTAKADATPPRAAKSGRTIEGAIEAFRTAQKREPTAEEIARMRRAL